MDYRPVRRRPLVCGNRRLRQRTCLGVDEQPPEPGWRRHEPVRLDLSDKYERQPSIPRQGPMAVRVLHWQRYSIRPLLQHGATWGLHRSEFRAVEPVESHRGDMDRLDGWFK